VQNPTSHFANGFAGSSSNGMYAAFPTERRHSQFSSREQLGQCVNKVSYSNGIVFKSSVLTRCWLLLSINFAYSGWNNSNNLLNEIGGNKIKRLKSAGSASIFLVFFLYFFANSEYLFSDALRKLPNIRIVAYIAAVPPEEAKKSGQLIAGIFFTKG
jgi:hypothetical protein